MLDLSYIKCHRWLSRLAALSAMQPKRRGTYRNQQATSKHNIEITHEVGGFDCLRLNHRIGLIQESS
jgi:hypothetical protein